MTEPAIHRFGCIGAYYAGENRHPQVVIKELYPDAADLEPAPIADCWMFTARPRDDAPGFISVRTGRT